MKENSCRGRSGAASSSSLVTDKPSARPVGISDMVMLDAVEGVTDLLSLDGFAGA